jgi:hypothetical protein
MLRFIVLGFAACGLAGSVAVAGGPESEASSQVRVAAISETGAGAPVVREWQFRAALDGRAIGDHTFRVADHGGEVGVESRASFDVSFLGFSVYTYEHRASERWKNGCLVSLDSHTDDNGEVQVVTGALGSDGFSLTRRGETTLLPACTMTFAYWNPAIRTQSRLLNPQTGDYLDVTIEETGAATLGAAPANRFAIRGKDLEIDLWYEAAGDRWLALDSPTTNGSLLSYRLSGDVTR